jgi:hypothetical protein
MEKLEIPLHKFGCYTFMVLNHKKGQEQDVSSLTQRGNKTSYPADWNLNALITLLDMKL